jgi:hypothetical protein
MKILLIARRTALGADSLLPPPPQIASEGVPTHPAPRVGVGTRANQVLELIHELWVPKTGADLLYCYPEKKERKNIRTIRGVGTLDRHPFMRKSLRCNNLNRVPTSLTGADPLNAL